MKLPRIAAYWVHAIGRCKHNIVALINRGTSDLDHKRVDMENKDPIWWKRKHNNNKSVLVDTHHLSAFNFVAIK